MIKLLKPVYYYNQDMNIEWDSTSDIAIEDMIEYALTWLQIFVIKDIISHISVYM